MGAAFYFLILTGRRLETREQIFTLSPVISVFLSPMQQEQGTAQLLGHQLRLRATPEVSPKFGLGSWVRVGWVWVGFWLRCRSCDVATRARR